MNENTNTTPELEDMGFTVIDLCTKDLGTETKWNIESVTGYKPQTTFYDDFAIADIFGPRAVVELFRRAFAEWKDNAVYITELSMVLNHRGWMHHHKQRKGYAALYFDMWEHLTQWIEENLKGEDLEYYYTTTD